MANAQVTIQNINFDISDEQLTKVTIKVELSGDYPHMMKKVYEKIFPARMSVIDIINSQDFKDYLLW